MSVCLCKCLCVRMFVWERVCVMQKKVICVMTTLRGGLKKDGFKENLMTCTSDTVRTHLQRFRTLGEDILNLCAHHSPYTGRTHRPFPSPQVASVRPRFEPTATPPSRATSGGCYRYANPPPFVHACVYACVCAYVCVFV